MLAFLLSAAHNNSVPNHGSSCRPLVYDRIGIQEEGNPSRDTPIEKPLGGGSFMRCRVLHLNPTERNTYHPCYLRLRCDCVSLKDHVRWEYVLSLSCNVLGNYGNCLLQICLFSDTEDPQREKSAEGFEEPGQ